MVTAFRDICHRTLPDFSEAEQALAARGAVLAENGLGRALHVVFEDFQTWLIGNPSDRALTDMRFELGGGVVNDAPAHVCLMVSAGLSAPDAEEALTDLLRTGAFIGEQDRGFFGKHRKWALPMGDAAPAAAVLTITTPLIGGTDPFGGQLTLEVFARGLPADHGLPERAAR